MLEDGYRRKILVVDNDANAREFLEYFLMQNGYTVVSAQNAEEGAEHLVREHIDVALSNVEQQRSKGGYWLLGYIREHHPDIPVFLMTNPDKIDWNHAQDAVGIFRRPLSIQGLERFVKDEKTLQEYRVESTHAA